MSWSLTGVVFLTKPGYEGAYEKLSPKTYEIKNPFRVVPKEGWHEIKFIRTILGYHLVVNDKGIWKHFDPDTLQERRFPSDAEIKALINDATSVNKERYGDVVEIGSENVVTDTGVEITLDWSKLSIKQSGSDTRLISAHP